MFFYEHETLYEVCHKTNKIPHDWRWHTFYAHALSVETRTPYRERDITSTIAIRLEANWYHNVRPYYKIWPSIIPALTRVPLDVPFASIRFLHTILCLRFCRGSKLQTAIVTTDQPTITITDKNPRPSLASIFQYGGEDASGSFILPFDDECQTVEEALSVYKPKLSVMLGTEAELDDVTRMVMRLAVGVALLANDPTIIEPDVLSKDERRFSETHNMAIVERARRRGKIGYHIGRLVEAMPHYRRPHFGLRWTGRGAAVPKIVPIKGAVVHRQKMARVPTGYILPDGTEIEKPE